ncbi:hypothetical protein RMR10_010285 [Agrobacterium rosae]|uniref:hypothetical protein n=1 Tax=Agrobacterium rosae TaxID=1972867 RepID=UPI002A106EDC|nr:hypothetical protein [Agrobacterium rosae]MDX8313011.1 hypothetical protein [Agrobacterium rosae]
MTGKVVIKDVHFADLNTGIKTGSPTDIEISGTTFDNVQTPFDLAPGSTARLTENSIKNDPKLVNTVRGGASLGWRRPKGPALPCCCPECKNIFPSKNYAFAGPYFHCWGNTEECIVCGYEKAELSKGTFDLSLETVGILIAPDITREMVKRLGQISTDVAYGKLSIDDAVVKAEKLHLSFGHVVREWGSRAIYGYLLLSVIAGDIDTALSLADRYTDNTVAIQRTVEQAFTALNQIFYENLANHPRKDNQPNNPVGSIEGHQISDGADSTDSGGPTDNEGVEILIPEHVPKPSPKPLR